LNEEKKVHENISIIVYTCLSVVEITRSSFNLGETVNLRLMRREKNSLFAMPVKSVIQPPTTFLSVSENAGNQIYSKLLIANVKDVSS